MRKTRGRKRTQSGGDVTTGKFINDNGATSRGAWDGKWSADKKTWKGNYTELDRRDDSWYTQLTRENGRIYRQRQVSAIGKPPDEPLGKPLGKPPDEPVIPTYNVPPYKELTTNNSIPEFKVLLNKEHDSLVGLRQRFLDTPGVLNADGNLPEQFEPYIDLLDGRLRIIEKLLDSIDASNLSDINSEIVKLNALVQTDVVPEIQQPKPPVYRILDYSKFLITTPIKDIKTALRNELYDLNELITQYTNYIDKAERSVDTTKEGKYVEYLKTLYTQVDTLFNKIKSDTTTSDIIDELHQLDHVKFTGGRRRRSRRRSHRRSRRRR
jgi:hypothetical protein